MLQKTASATALGLFALGPAAAQEMAVPEGATVDPQIGIVVPDGFEVTVFADGIGRARHLAVRDNGDVYVALREIGAEGGMVGLRDTDGDGQADEIKGFGTHIGTGIAIHGDHLYGSTDVAVFRYPLPEKGLMPEGREIVVSGFPAQGSHASKAFAIDPEGTLYVNVGAPSNACMEQSRTPGSPGMAPCPLLEEHAGIWRFDAEALGQTFADGERYVTGSRHVVALDWNPSDNALYLVQHGRDQLQTLFPDLYSAEESAEQPAEEFHKVTAESNVGWPYTYWDWQRSERILAPEYGGDGKAVVADGDYQDPLIGFPGHWAPNDLLFLTGGPHDGDALIAFHGSWNRAPLPQGGYKVVYVPFADGAPGGEWSVFADGFKGAERIMAPDEARFRPMGLAQGPDGALYIADSIEGRIWRVTHAG